MTTYPSPERDRFRSQVLNDGSVLVEWTEPGAPLAGNAFAPAGQLQVWPGENGRPSSVRLTLAEGVTPTNLQRFPWAKMLGTAEAVTRFEAIREELPGRLEEAMPQLATDMVAEGLLDPGADPRTVEKIGLRIWELANKELEERYREAVGQVWAAEKQPQHPAPGQGAPKRHPGRKGHPDDFYRDVACRYLELRAQGKTNPTTLIARDDLVSRDTVSDWVKGARERGYLPPGLRGRAG